MAKGLRVQWVVRTSNGVTVTQSSEGLIGCRCTSEGKEGLIRSDDCFRRSSEHRIVGCYSLEKGRLVPEKR